MLNSSHCQILRLKKNGQNKTDIGHILNLVSNDLNRFEMPLITTPFFLVTPITFTICTYLLWEELGAAAFVGIAFVLILAPLQCKRAQY